MTKDELIVKQQLEIEEYKSELNYVKKISEDIKRSLYCIGAPLNDNKLQFNIEQLKWLLALAVKIDNLPCEDDE